MVSVTKLNYKEPVYDITTQKGSVIINGVKVHNCAEIIQFSSALEIAVCNLASIALNRFWKAKGDYDYAALGQTVMYIIRNLNRIIDCNFYPVPETEVSNKKHRPVGLGVQGLADLFMLERVAFDSERAKELNRYIFETIYYYAVKSSMLIAQEEGPYGTYEGSPISQGWFQFDLWNREVATKIRLINLEIGEMYNNYLELTRSSSYYQTRSPEQHWLEFLGQVEERLNELLNQDIINLEQVREIKFQLHNTKVNSGMFDWNELRRNVLQHGVRNSLLTACMPTASTAQILGNFECIEPVRENLYKRRTLAGEFQVVNKYLINHLIELDLWSDDMRKAIVGNNGSIFVNEGTPGLIAKELERIPEDIRSIYKTTFEISQRVLIDLAADRGGYIDQTQSMNLFMREPRFNKISNMLLYGWRKGLKTGMYYFRSAEGFSNIKFTLDPSYLLDNNTAPQLPLTDQECLPDDDGVCEMCTS